jgi:arylsulfatase A-like enzyme
MSAVNTPLRGAKQQNYEGGIRTPFIVSWPAAFKGGRTIATPITSLDILPTALEAAGVKRRPRNRSTAEKPAAAADRKNAAAPRHVLLERRRRGGRVRRPLRRLETRPAARQPKVELFNLAQDPAETTDLAPQNAAKVAELMKLYDTWLDQMAEPMDGVGKRPNKSAGPTKKEKKKKRAEK